MHDLSSQLSGLVEESERCLILGKYAESESISSNILSSLRKLEVSEETLEIRDELVERAAVVFLQSCYETSNFASARSRLCSWHHLCGYTIDDCRSSLDQQRISCS
mmetsp:Transcript_3351/g.6734  ORF Transcript_3351/g.6734 Transcript_3351/m.6734 type:complete len:106 (+) Transcript_3351:3347-3664(+)